MIAAWKVSNQAEASVKEAHVEPAEVELAPRKETVVESAPTKKDQQGESNTSDDTSMEMVDAWIAYCDRSKADDKVLSDCLSALRDESTRVSVSCQTAFDEEVAEEAAESGRTADAEEAVEKGSLEIKEGGPTGKVLGARDTEYPPNYLNEDDFVDGCNCNVDHQVVRYSDFVNLFVEKAAEADSGFEVGHIVVNVPAFFDHSQRKAIRDAGAISGLYVCRISNEPEPVTEPRGCPGEEPSSQAQSSLQGESCVGTSESVPEPMLRAAFCLLQMAYLLLQSGQQAREVEEKAAKGATRVSVACQAALDEEDWRHCDESSGYGSDGSSLVEEGSPYYASHESGVFSLTSPSDVASTISVEMLYSTGHKKPVLCNERRIRRVYKKNPLVMSQAAAGQHKVLLVPADGEQLGRVKAQEQQGQAKAHAVSKSSG